jgi:hypothetical protein
MIQFSEANGGWQPIPQWVGFMIRLGYAWPVAGQRPRRVTLVSMPSDSAAAGLITLGALIRDLGDPQANDIDGHYDRLLAYAQQFLENCLKCELPSCDPNVKGCGQLKEVTGRVRSAIHPQGIYQISERTSLTERQIAFSRAGIVRMPKPQYATDWHIDGEPPPQWSNAEGELSADRYRGFVPEAPVHSENLRQSYSGLCLAGRVGGENASREICSSVRFSNGMGEFSLDDLITVHGWSACNVSRIAFFNPRTGRLDRNVATPRLVVADGDASFLDVIDRPEFRMGDIVGVTHRILERVKLETLGNKMSALRQWYVPDEDMLYGLPEVPRGISISILRRRT